MPPAYERYVSILIEDEDTRRQYEKRVTYIIHLLPSIRAVAMESQCGRGRDTHSRCNQAIRRLRLRLVLGIRARVLISGVDPCVGEWKGILQVTGWATPNVPIENPPQGDNSVEGSL